jgi:hypothetical protein
MKKKYLFIGILMAVTLQAYAQKPDESTKSEEYEIERTYDPTILELPENTIQTATKPIPTPGVVGVASFEGKYFEKERFVRLTWIMSKKLGIFIIEHAANGDGYQEIGKVDNPIGFEQSKYTFDAKKIEVGLNFYRLKQNINGEAIYSEVKGIMVTENNDILVFELTDNGSSIRVTLRSREIQQVTIQLYDLEGNLKKELLNQDMTVNEIIFRDINKDDFPVGDYFVLVKGHNFKQSKKITLP